MWIVIGGRSVCAHEPQVVDGRRMEWGEGLGGSGRGGGPKARARRGGHAIIERARAGSARRCTIKYDPPRTLGTPIGMRWAAAAIRHD
jgi:hypothetical protein